MGSGTNTPIVIAIFSFQLFIIVIMGLIGGSIQANTIASTPSDPGILSFLSDTLGFFISGLHFALTNIPAVFNLLLFLPTIIGLFYILVSFLRGSS